MGKMMTQRAGVLSELPSLLCELGGDVTSVFDGTGIDPDTLDADTRVPFTPMLTLLERAARQTNCPHLGLLIGQRFDFVLHGPLGKLMLTAPRLGQALMDFVTCQQSYSSGTIVYLNQFDDICAFGYGTYAASHRGSQILYDAVIGVALRMIEVLTNSKVKPVEIHFSHRAPEDVTAYARLLKIPMQFDQYRSCILLDAESLQVTLPSSDPALRCRLQADISRSILRDAPDLLTRTRQAVRHVLYTNTPSLSAVAAEMSLHPRTLERRLAQEGETFRSLRDDVRFSVARELLDLTEIPIGEIAAMLAFASPGVFSDAFRRRSGTSPSLWRAKTSPSWN
ncbi:AraC family transcriptional regulator [Sedimentitalea sp. XS_ASV28]|uniref:AraC family transcriptional regulator n=1 Tax=Sedimentitalea sp. XS_ASV28 TaxID=3241296 RepID=UPI003518382C